MLLSFEMVLLMVSELRKWRVQVDDRKVIELMNSILLLLLLSFVTGDHAGGGARMACAGMVISSSENKV